MMQMISFGFLTLINILAILLSIQATSDLVPPSTAVASWLVPVLMLLLALGVVVWDRCRRPVPGVFLSSADKQLNLAGRQPTLTVDGQTFQVRCHWKTVWICWVQGGEAEVKLTCPQGCERRLRKGEWHQLYQGDALQVGLNHLRYTGAVASHCQPVSAMPLTTIADFSLDGQ